MKDIVTREKEYRRLNEELDQLALSTVPQAETAKPCKAMPTSSAFPRRTPAQAPVVGKLDTKFLTYTKARSTPGARPPAISPNASPPPPRVPPHARPVVNALAAQPSPQQPAQLKETEEDDTVQSCLSAADLDIYPSNTGTYKVNSGLNSRIIAQRGIKRSKYPGKSTAPGKQSEIQIKYQNALFSESPSLELIFHEEKGLLLGNGDSKATAKEKSNSKEAKDIKPAESVRSSISRISAGDDGKKYNTSGLIKFLRSKVSILEQDHERMTGDIEQHKQKLDKALEQQKRAEYQRDQAIAKKNLLAEQVASLQSQLDEANTHLKERINEGNNQQKELEQTKREVKMLKQSNINLEKRLTRTTDELESNKNALGKMREADREYREAVRVENENKDIQVKNLKKQRAELLNAYKKQLFLIDNLKRQNICMEQAKMIGVTEKEFAKVLQWQTRKA